MLIVCMKITNMILCALTWDSVFQGISDPCFHSKLPGYTTGKETYGQAGSGWGSPDCNTLFPEVRHVAGRPRRRPSNQVPKERTEPRLGGRAGALMERGVGAGPLLGSGNMPPVPFHHLKSKEPEIFRGRDASSRRLKVPATARALGVA